MPSYGYRLFRVQLHRGQGRKPVNYASCNGEHFAAVAARLLKQMQASTIVGLPSSDQPADALIADPEPDEVQPGGERALRFSDIKAADFAIRASFLSGRYGDHQTALGRPGVNEDVNITDRAPSRPYRMALNLPEDGTAAFLAVEDVSRSCPVTPVIRWLARYSRDAAVGSKDPALWFRMTANQLADEDRLNTMLSNGQFERLELVKHSISKDRTRDRVQFRLTAPSIEDVAGNKISTLVKGWVKAAKPAKDGSKTVISDKDGAKAIAAIIGAKVEDLDFDDGWVVLSGDDSGKRQRISPSRISELFTYPLGDRRPSDVAFYTAAATTAQGLQKTAQITVGWPQQFE